MREAESTLKEINLNNYLNYKPEILNNDLGS